MYQLSDCSHLVGSTVSLQYKHTKYYYDIRYAHRSGTRPWSRKYRLSATATARASSEIYKYTLPGRQPQQTQTCGMGLRSKSQCCKSLGRLQQSCQSPFLTIPIAIDLRGARPPAAVLEPPGFGIESPAGWTRSQVLVISPQAQPSNLAS